MIEILETANGQVVLLALTGFIFKLKMQHGCKIHTVSRQYFKPD